MSGTSIVSLQEENMYAYDSTLSIPLAFLPPPMMTRNHLPRYLTPEQVNMEPFSTIVHGLIPPNLVASPFDRLPFVPLPRSTAAELSWFRVHEQVEPIFEEEDSDHSIESETSYSTESEVYVATESYAPERYSSATNMYITEPMTKLEPVDLHSLALLRGLDPIPIIPAMRQLGKPRIKRIYKREVPLQNLTGYKKVSHRHTPGKKPKLKVRWTLRCCHCGKIFNARPTPKNSRYVVNHICPQHENKRKQFVIGTKARRCEETHDGPCIQQLCKTRE